jgi:hypothetical protein
MSTDKRNLVASRLAILVGFSYFATSIIFFLMPSSQRPGVGSFADRMASLADNALPFTIYYAVFALGAVAALGAIPAVSDFITGERDGWLVWAANLALVGFAVMAVDLLRVIAIVPAEASAFVQQTNELGRFAIGGDNIHLDLDPDGWLQFGAVGLWVLVVSLLNLRGRSVSSAWSYVGVGLAVTYWLIVLANLINLGPLYAVVSALGGLVLAPIWYIWLGISMGRDTGPAATA